MHVYKQIWQKDELLDDTIMCNNLANLQAISLFLR